MSNTPTENKKSTVYSSEDVDKMIDGLSTMDDLTVTNSLKSEGTTTTKNIVVNGLLTTDSLTLSGWNISIVE